MTSMLRTTTNRHLRPGDFCPLGATLTPEGANFALYSRDASAVFLLLFDRATGAGPTDIIALEHRTKLVWHTFVEGVRAGQLYGYKVIGDFDPVSGRRFNVHKLLVDPYAKALSHKAVNTDNLLLGYDPSSAERDLSLDTRDNSHLAPKAVVVDDDFDWRCDVRPNVPLERLVIYEVHPKGFTAHASSGVRNPGTYLGFIEKIPYLKSLGINAVELLPIHEHYVEDFLRDRGLTNYWGYNTLGFFAPELSYASSAVAGQQVAELKALVCELHKAGIEVLLDVVYNHTAEGNELGPTLSLKGIDNRSYYQLCGDSCQPGRYYSNFTGCGNTMNLTSVPAIRLVMDSLRYWAEVMHVDGFRFDLAAALGRERDGFASSSSFFDTISQDPVLQRVKLIAEPWDLGTMQLGNFPVDWSEWNGRWRDTVRRFIKGDGSMVGDLGARLTGSADLYGDDGRSPFNSINFVTCHDGFTLYDLVSYNQKHNEANGEGNRDGTNDNNSWNCGAEGETNDPEVLRLRRQLAKNHICLLLFSCGTPMVLGGDEFLRSQRGNNNAFCQDSGLSYFDWDYAQANVWMTDFFRKAVRLTRRHPILQRRKFFVGEDLDQNGAADIVWYGNARDTPRWNDPELRTLCYQLDGNEADTSGSEYRLFFILNADPRLQEIKLPVLPRGWHWHRLVDTSLPSGDDFVDPDDPQSAVRVSPGDHYLANGRSVVVLVGRA